MTPERWQRIQDLFYEAEEIPPAERQGFLAVACDGDAELRREVEELLGTASADPGRVDACVGAAAEEILASEVPAPLKSIGAYQVIRPLGEGGMGVVYLARRADQTYEQVVAIKIIRPEFALKSAVARFVSERQMLANLAHPNIARLLDGGVTEGGQPYFVMEYIEGQTVDVWCRERDLTVREKLDLFRSICAGVQSAHQNLIIHRDIKPANILVGRDGIPKLLDFGIAKIMEPGSAAQQTRATERFMTPEFASPEQILGLPTTTATDVYALGVLLYQLLSGVSPFAGVPRTPGELERSICYGNISKPSTAVNPKQEQAQAIRSSLRGDLDNIVLKAMHKDPARRYATAAEFSDDILRYLRGFPVAARADSMGYRAGKFVRRHRVPVAAAALLSITLIGFGIGMAVLAQRADAQRRRAEQVSSFLIGLFSAADPDKPARQDMTARDMLERGVRQVDQLASEPQVQAELLNTFGLVYENLGEWNKSRGLLRRSLALKQKIYPAGSLELANEMKALAELARRQTDYVEAEQMARRSLEIRLKQLGPKDVDVAESRNTLGIILHETGRYKEAEQMFLQVLAQGDELRKRDHLESGVLSNIGALYGDMGELAKAQQFLGRCVETRRVQLGPKHPRLALALAKLANIQGQDGKLDAAEQGMKEALSIRIQVFGQNHAEVARTLLNLATIHRKEHRLADARRDIESAGAMLESRRTVDPSSYSLLQLEQGLLLEAEGRLADAERVLRACREERQLRLGPQHLQVAKASAALASVLSSMGKPEEAIALLNAATPILIAHASPYDDDRKRATQLLARLSK